MPANHTYSTKAALKRNRNLLVLCAAMVKNWYRRSQDRAYLETLDTDRLKDIGLSPARRNREVNKPFWKA